MALTQKSKAPGKTSAAQSVKATAKNAITKGKAKPIASPSPKSKSAKPMQEKLAKVAKAKAALKQAKVKAVEVKAAPAPVVAAPAPKAKKTGKGRKLSIDIAAGESMTALAAKWGSLFKKAEQIEAKPYNMRLEFVEKTAIVHKILGWGYILANRNDRLEVLFKDGIKYLISNYKP